MTDKISFTSVNTKMSKIPMIPVNQVKASTVELEAIRELSEEQKNVFDNIEKIKASNCNYSVKKGDQIYDLKTLKEFLKLFGNYKLSGKADVIAELVNQYKIYDYKLEKQDVQINMVASGTAADEDDANFM